MAILCQVVICIFHSKRSILPVCVVQLLKKLFLIIYKTKAMYVPACCATIAFGNVSFTELRSLLPKRDIPAVILRVVLDLYTRHNVTASWNGCISKHFSVNNGVRQVGVLSPILYNAYMDEPIHIFLSDINCWSVVLNFMNQYFGF